MIGIPLATKEFLPGEAWLGLLGIIPITAAASAAVAWHFKQTSWPVPLVASAGGLVVVGILALGAIRADQHRHDQKMVVEWANPATQNGPVVSYGVLEPSWVFYTHRIIPQLLGRPSELARQLREHPQTCLITREQLVPALDKEFAGDLEVVDSTPLFLRKEQLVILRLKPRTTAEKTARVSQGKKESL